MVLGRCGLITDNFPYADGSEKASADSLADDDGDGNKMLSKALKLSANALLPFGAVMALKRRRLITFRTVMVL